MVNQSDIFFRILKTLDAKNAPEAARLLGISKQAVYDWQKNTPSIDNLLKITESRNTSLHWILMGEGARFVDQTQTLSIDEVLERKIRQIVREELREKIPGEVGPVLPAEQITVEHLGTVSGGEEEEGRLRKKKTR